MKLAVGAHGLERQKWFDLAIAWRELARGQPARQPHKTNVEAAAQSGAGVAWRQDTVVLREIFKHIGGKFRPGQDWAFEVTVYVIRIETRHIG
jgi:hypothetical protein